MITTTAPASPRPLPRSLDPLPAESLPGYLLRLAHRLDLSPARLAFRTGLLSHRTSNLSASRMLSLDPVMAQQFAVATRLSSAEVNALTLSSLAGRYLPLQQRPSDRHLPIHSVYAKQAWIFARCTRYCSSCLAGDGSIIQQHHGGSWSNLWRLPVVFACPTHRVLLRHTCPACGRPAHFRVTPGSPLLPLAAHTGLHPSACRNSIPGPGPGSWDLHRPCAQRLDKTFPLPDQAPATLTQLISQDTLDLQTKLLALLDPHSPDTVTSFGEPTTAGRYFVDLRILTCLITASWPVARDLAAPGQPTHLIDQHAHATHRSIEQAGPRMVREIAFHDRPPLDTATAAATLALADTITTEHDLTSVSQLLRDGLLHAPPPLREWIKKKLGGHSHCSPGLQAIAGPETGALHILRRTSDRTHHLMPPPRPVRFNIRHIPQDPPPQWCQHFTDFTDISPLLLRRTITVRLAQMCVGGPPFYAGTLLGIPAHAASHAVGEVHRRLGSPAREALFEAAIDTLARHLGAATDLVDYGRRRDALTTWTITPDEWHSLTAALATRSRPHGGGAPTDWGDTKRVLASVWIWVRITHGEHVYATPIRPDPQQPAPGGQLAQAVHHLWPFIAAARRDHYADLRALLDPYADHLANQIDNNEFHPVRQES